MENGVIYKLLFGSYEGEASAKVRTYHCNFKREITSPGQSPGLIQKLKVVTDRNLGKSPCFQFLSLVAFVDGVNT